MTVATQIQWPAIMSTSDSAPSILSQLPGIHVAEDFLSPADHTALLEDSLANESNYQPSLVSRYHAGRLEGGAIDQAVRRSTCRALPPRLRDLFRIGVESRKEAISDALGLAFPDERKFEIQAVHSGDGAHFSRHIDTTLGSTGRFRVVSAVYYYSTPARDFSGGELELFSLDQTRSMRIAPKDNSMVFFPSIFAHEVLPVHVPSGAFAAGRFSVNCWVNRAP